MSSRPSRWLIVGQKVLDEIASRAPESVKKTVVALFRALEHGPYPGDCMLHAAPAKGFGRPNAFVAWFEDVTVLYQVMKDQPVISLVGVGWLKGDGTEFQPIWPPGDPT